MGVNEYGVAIGSEALFTMVKPEKFPGLIGMDLLRLALERADSAGAAVHVIIRCCPGTARQDPADIGIKGFST